MSTRTTTLEEFISDAGTRYQLLYTPGSAAAWSIIIDGELDTSYDDYGDARRAWAETLAEAQ